MAPKSFADSQDRPAAVTTPSVSWFPGNMLKASRRLASEVRTADVVLEMRDARLPLLSGNPELEKLLGRRKRLILLNKAELAETARNGAWQAFFREREQPALLLDAETGKGINLIHPAIRKLTEELSATFRRRGIRPPLPRVMVVGMPNVGKSTLINRLIRHKTLKTAPTPGVTRSITWVNLKGRYQFMDSPGVMLPRLENPGEALKLGWIGTIRDAAFGKERLAAALLDFLLENAGEAVRTFYKLAEPFPLEGSAALASIAHARRLLRQGGAPDPVRAAEQVLGDFRKGKLGRFTLETPP